jgi:diguanylate cyclase (GGDEF)-like protein
MTSSLEGKGGDDAAHPSMNDPAIKLARVVGHPISVDARHAAVDGGDGVSLREELARLLEIDAASLAGVPDHEVAPALRRVRELIRRVVDLETRVTVDDLTGVMRRGPGLAMLGEEMDRARRLEMGLAVAFVDVDALKRVNDTSGHAAGDEVLRTVAATLRGGLRSYDLVMRYGGDEFVCVLFGADTAGAERLVREVGDAIRDATGGITVTVGLAMLLPDDDDDSLLRRADAALLAARRQRRAEATAAPR